MFQGTGSDVGKSLIVAGLCRAFANRGLNVRPFKPQNMSNNAAVTADGGEIGRAQALQARACRIAPTVDMNPVLLKPQSDVGAQLVVRGKVMGNAPAREFQAMKQGLSFEAVEADFVASAEYFQKHGSDNRAWVTGLYNDLLGRAPDAAGLMGYATAAYGIGQIAGPLVAAPIAAHTGSFSPALWLAAGALLAGAVGLIAVTRRPRGRGRMPDCGCN